MCVLSVYDHNGTWLASEPCHYHTRASVGEISGKLSQSLKNNFANANLQILGIVIKVTYEDTDNKHTEQQWVWPSTSKPEALVGLEYIVGL